MRLSVTGTRRLVRFVFSDWEQLRSFGAEIDALTAARDAPASRRWAALEA